MTIQHERFITAGRDPFLPAQRSDAVRSSVRFSDAERVLQSRSARPLARDYSVTERRAQNQGRPIGHVSQYRTTV
jgi:hypothetical protein